MTTLRQLLLALAGMFAILVIAALIVVGLAEITPHPEHRQSPTEINFRAACEAAKGNAVWNGRHWECLK